MQGYAPVQPPSLHRHGDDEPAEEEEDDLVPIGCRHLSRGEDTKDREEDQREQSGRLQGNRARNPEQDHEDSHCRNRFCFGGEEGGIDRDRQDREEDEECR